MLSDKLDVVLLTPVVPVFSSSAFKASACAFWAFALALEFLYIDKPVIEALMAVPASAIAPPTVRPPTVVPAAAPPVIVAPPINYVLKKADVAEAADDITPPIAPATPATVVAAVDIAVPIAAAAATRLVITHIFFSPLNTEKPCRKQGFIFCTRDV